MKWFKTNKVLRQELAQVQAQLHASKQWSATLERQIAIRNAELLETKKARKVPSPTTTQALKVREYVPPRSITPPPKPRPVVTPSPSYYSPPPPPAPAPSTSLADIAIGAAIGYGISSLLSDDESSSSSSGSSCSNDSFSSGGGGDFGGGGASGSWD